MQVRLAKLTNLQNANLHVDFLMRNFLPLFVMLAIRT